MLTSSAMFVSLIVPLGDKLLHAETNLSGGDGSMIGLYESYVCFHYYNIQRSNYNHLPEIDTAHLTLVIDNPPTHL